MYDEEATLQDDDILQAQYEAESRHIRSLQRQGICTHGSGLGVGDGRGPLEGGAYYPEQIGLKPGQIICTEKCGRIFDSFEEQVAAAKEATS